MPRSTAGSNVVAVRRPRRTTPISNIDQQIHLYIANWRAASVAGNARDKANKLIKQWFAATSFGDRDVAINDNGSQILTFEEPLLVDGNKYLGLENRRTVKSELDLDLVDEWLSKQPKAKQASLRARLYKKVVTEEFDPDELFAMQQQGLLTEDQLDGMFEAKESWALCVVKD